MAGIVIRKCIVERINDLLDRNIQADKHQLLKALIVEMRSDSLQANHRGEKRNSHEHYF
jgi:hypothetical protein